MCPIPSLSVIVLLAIPPQADQARSWHWSATTSPKRRLLSPRRPRSPSGFAAEELQFHVRKITGVTLPIVPDTVSATGLRVLIRRSKATDALGLAGEPLKPQEYIIRYLPDTLGAWVVRPGPPSPSPRVAGRADSAGPWSSTAAATW